MRTFEATEERIIKMMGRGWRLCYVINAYMSGLRLIGPRTAEGVDDIVLFRLSDKVMQRKPGSAIDGHTIQAEWVLK